MTSDLETSALARLKRSLRAEAKARRAALSEEERRAQSEKAHTVLTSSAAWQGAESVGLFCSMRDEIDTRHLLREIWDAGKRVALPFTPPLSNPLRFYWVNAEAELVRNTYGVDEPSPGAEVATVSELNLLVVPGLAFDDRGARLGYGGGYYDRTLGDAVQSVMLAFACQQIDQVPEGPHDQRVDAVVTEDGWKQRALT